MITYELHTLKNDITQTEWTMTAVFEDLELAMHDATRLDETKRYAGIRVVEEKHNEVTGKTDTKTVFRGGVKFNAAKEKSYCKPAKPIHYFILTKAQNCSDSSTGPFSLTFIVKPESSF